ncbi:hypothetical protein DPMN_174971 [Dreissena polymorpha]|uniref:Uncharacterized protein n=1 Tax=Dreissena polymorpha TaxID=45954 RepID=A0A9D4E7B5_DREPO|nr:hypothetical protein DPMN_174971 [Dreissena polymorpha]
MQKRPRSVSPDGNSLNKEGKDGKIQKLGAGSRQGTSGTSPRQSNLFNAKFDITKH